MDQTPAITGDAREESGSVRRPPIQPAGAEQGLVPGFVQDGEPLDHGDRQSELACQPDPDVV